MHELNLENFYKLCFRGSKFQLCKLYFKIIYGSIYHIFLNEWKIIVFFLFETFLCFENKLMNDLKNMKVSKQQVSPKCDKYVTNIVRRRIMSCTTCKSIFLNIISHRPCKYELIACCVDIKCTYEPTRNDDGYFRRISTPRFENKTN